MNRRNFRHWWILLPAFLLAGQLAAETAAITVPIGVIGALTGPKSPYGVSQLQGAQLAADEVNRENSGGPHLAVVSRDDKGEMGLVGSLMTDLLFQEKVFAVIGSTDSGCTHVMSMVCVKMQVPHFTCVSTDPSITRAGSPWTFRTLADDERQGAALIQFLESRRKADQRIGILAAASRYGKMGAQTLVRIGRDRGMVVASPIWLASEGSDAAGVVSKVLTERPGIVIVWALAREGLLAVRELRKQGFNGLILGGDGLATPAFFASGVPEAEGVILTCPYLENRVAPENSTFRAAFRQRFGKNPDSFAAHAYDTVRLLYAGLKSSDGSRASLREQMWKVVPFVGATGVLDFDASGNDIRPVITAVCREQKLVPTESGR
jgi:branched-chain amino acid transport system substrate-binding protein